MTSNITPHALSRYSIKANELGLTVVEYLAHQGKDVYCNECKTWKLKHLFPKLPTPKTLTGKCSSCRVNTSRRPSNVDVKSWPSWVRAANKLNLPVGEYSRRRLNGERFCVRCKEWFFAEDLIHTYPEILRFQYCAECVRRGDVTMIEEDKDNDN